MIDRTMPKAFGYVCTSREEFHPLVSEWRRAIQDTASREGMALVGVFVEEPTSSSSLFQMRDAVARDGVKYILTPGADHLEMAMAAPVRGVTNLAAISAMLRAQVIIATCNPVEPLLSDRPERIIPGTTLDNYRPRRSDTFASQQ